MTDPIRAHSAPQIQDSQNQDSDKASDRVEAAAYIAELATNLALMARKHGLDSLGYIFEMAKLEAESATRHVKGRR